MKKLQDRIQLIIDTFFDGNKLAFSRALGVTEGAVRAWLNARNTPTQDMIERIADVTGIPFAFIDEGVGPTPTPDNLLAAYRKFDDAQKGAFRTRMFEIWNQHGISILKVPDRNFQIVFFRKMIHGSIKPTAQQIGFVLKAGYRYRWILNGEGPKLVGPVGEQPPPPQTTDTIPILAAPLLRKHIFTHETAEESVQLPFAGSYAFRVPDNSMSPKYLEGTIVIAHPDSAPDYRQTAIVKIADQVLVREYRQFEGKVLLRALNPEFDDILIDPKEIEFAHRILFSVEG